MYIFVVILYTISLALATPPKCLRDLYSCVGTKTAVCCTKTGIDCNKGGTQFRLRMNNFIGCQSRGGSDHGCVYSTDTCVADSTNGVMPYRVTYLSAANMGITFAAQMEYEDNLFYYEAAENEKLAAKELAMAQKIARRKRKRKRGSIQSRLYSNHYQY
eukprot:92455_1